LDAVVIKRHHDLIRPHSDNRLKGPGARTSPIPDGLAITVSLDRGSDFHDRDGRSCRYVSSDESELRERG